MKMKNEAIMLENYKELQRQYTRLLEDKSFRCPKCFEKLVWNDDMDMEDGYVGKISYYHCLDCGIQVEVTEFEHGDIDAMINGTYDDELKIDEGDIPF